MNQIRISGRVRISVQDLGPFCAKQQAPISVYTLPSPSPSLLMNGLSSNRFQNCLIKVTQMIQSPQTTKDPLKG